MSARKPLAPQHGFTLLEMLIAFVLVSLLFVALFSSFHTIAHGWEAADKRMGKTEDMRLIEEFLRRQLSQAMVVRIKGEKKDTTVYAFEGSATEVRYAAPLQPLQNQGGVFLIELAIVSGKNGQALQMRYAPYRPELTWDDAFSKAAPVLVFDGLKSAKFGYFGAEKPTDDAQWETDWKGKPVYPQLLKLSLADAERAWPDVLISLPQVSDYGK